MAPHEHEGVPERAGEGRDTLAGFVLLVIKCAFSENRRNGALTSARSRVCARRAGWGGGVRELFRKGGEGNSADPSPCPSTTHGGHTWVWDCCLSSLFSLLAVVDVVVVAHLRE